MNFNTDLIIESIKSLHDEIETVFTQYPLSVDAITKIEKKSFISRVFNGRD